MGILQAVRRSEGVESVYILALNKRGRPMLVDVHKIALRLGRLDRSKVSVNSDVMP